ncbi:sensor domain-containing diguanylate cyclase [Aureimonas psammosilenae]|uniref:sensor domain-containing diguanylate cyclase n=1 Tax=Aureimonas psammosilenae TaxID=2495496 RepID=UPI001260CE92|nr:sensor domain-containing diguanylate cyclase [Aureimonas psammosilenae]
MSPSNTHEKLDPLSLFRETIELLPEAAVIFDAEDRYLFWNAKYEEFYAESAHSPLVGQLFEDYLRQLLELKQVPAAVGRETDWLAERMARHRQPFSRYEHQIAGSRWIRVEERRLASGGTIGTRVDITELKQREFQLAYLAHHDAMTGLANRVLLQERLEGAIARSSPDAPAAVVGLDLDRFKHVNDHLGHHAGDELLRQVAVRLRGAVRSSDTVARVGGDEFVILIPDLPDPRFADDALGRIQDRVSEPYLVFGNPVAIGASAGLALIPQDGQSCDALLRHCDNAMYSAKVNGRGAQASRE